MLVEHGASPVAELDGFTPAELALNYGQNVVYDYLISLGAAPVGAASTAQIELIAAAGGGGLPSFRGENAITKMDHAIGQGARINDTGPNNQTALIAALRDPIFEVAQVEVIRWLLDHGANPNQKGNSGFGGIEGLPLHLIVALNKVTLAGEAVARPDAKLMAEAAMTLLLNAGANVSGLDSQDRTPLHVAAKFDNVRAAEILVKAGARVMARDVNGRTPLDYAESAPMIRLLKASGATER